METITSPKSTLVNLLRRLKKLSPKQKMLAGLDVTYAQIRLLRTVSNFSGNTMKQISNSLGLAFPTLSKSACTLLKQGLLDLRPDPDDRRKKRVHLTQEGEIIVRNFIREEEKLASQFLSGLLPEEQDIFLDLLEKVISVAEASNV